MSATGQNRNSVLLLAPILGALAILPAVDSWAQEGNSQQSTRELDLVSLRAELESGNEERITHALVVIGEAGSEGERAVHLVEQLLARGANAAITQRAVELVGNLGLPTSTPYVVPYVRHRKLEIRRAAVYALRRGNSEAAIQGLRSALRDRDARVRELAATSLGRVRAVTACDDLLVALTRGVAPAAEPLGSFCGTQQLQSVRALVGRTPWKEVAPVFRAALLRADSDLPLDTKTSLVTALVEKGGRDAKDLLRELLKQWPQSASAELAKEMERMLAQPATKGAS